MIKIPLMSNPFQNPLVISHATRYIVGDSVGKTPSAGAEIWRDYNCGEIPPQRILAKI